MNVIFRLALASALLLAGLTPAGAQNLPGGSYQSSCGNIYTQGPTLFASCTAPNGARVFRRFNFTHFPRGADIGNNNGRLGCNGGGFRPGGGYRPGYGGGVPQGSYLQSCRHVHVNGGQLIATCSAPNGQPVRSSMPLGACRHGGDIANNNGRLGCNFR
jgi:hypothetical protein